MTQNRTELAATWPPTAAARAPGRAQASVAAESDQGQMSGLRLHTRSAKCGSARP